MKKPINEFQLLILLFEKLENNEDNSFTLNQSFIKYISSQNFNIPKGELEKFKKRYITYQWIKQETIAGENSTFSLTDKGKNIALSKRKDYNENPIKKFNKWLGEYKNIAYFILFIITLVITYLKILGDRL